METMAMVVVLILFLGSALLFGKKKYRPFCVQCAHSAAIEEAERRGQDIPCLVSELEENWPRPFREAGTCNTYFEEKPNRLARDFCRIHGCLNGQ